VKDGFQGGFKKKAKGKAEEESSQAAAAAADAAALQDAALAEGLSLGDADEVVVEPAPAPPAKKKGGGGGGGGGLLSWWKKGRAGGSAPASQTGGPTPRARTSPVASFAHAAADRMAATARAAKEMATAPPSAHEGGVVPSNTATLRAAAAKTEGEAAQKREEGIMQTEAVLARTAQAWSGVLPAGDELRAAAEGGGPHASYKT
jgi:hypothetical protein